MRPGPDWGWIAVVIITALVLFFLIAPVLVVIPMSFSSAKYLEFPPPGFSLQWYQSYFGQGNWVQPTVLSLEMAASVAILSALLGIPAAIALVRGRFPGRGLINALAISPMIVPEIIIAIAIFYAFAQVHAVGHVWALIVAQTALGVPFVIINASAALYGMDQRLERAAQILGASPLRAFFAVTLPLMRSGVLAGALFAFITSWDDLLIPLFLSGPTTVTLPLRMWQGLREQIDPTISAVSTLLIVITTVILVLAEMLRRRTERIRTRAVLAQPGIAGLEGGVAAVK